MAIALKQKSSPLFLGERYIDELVDMYKAAALDLKERAVKRLLRDPRKLTVEARRARLLLAEVREILLELDAKTAEWIAENIPRHYRNGISRATMGLSDIGFKGAYVATPEIHRDALEVLVADMQDDLLAATEQVMKGFRRVLRKTQLHATMDKAITQEIAKGVVAGKARREVSKEIAGRLFDEFGRGPIKVGKRTFGIDHYAELVARTKTREAVTAGLQNRMIEAGQDLVMISSHGSPCWCGMYEGKVFSISGTHEKYPPIWSLPNGGAPFHPHCEHVEMPFIEDLASGAEVRRASGVDSEYLNKSAGEIQKYHRRAA